MTTKSIIFTDVRKAELLEVDLKELGDNDRYKDAKEYGPIGE